MGAAEEQRVVAAALEEARLHDDCGPPRRARLTVAVVVLVAVAEVAFGVMAYGNLSDVDFAIALACGGVAMLAIVDLWIRPRREDHGARRLRRFMPLWALLPFLCALGSSVWVHYRQWQSGLHDIGELARELKAADGAPTPAAGLLRHDGHDGRDGQDGHDGHDGRDGKAGGDSAEAAQLASVAGRFALELAAPAESRQFYELARVILHDLKRADGDVDALVRRARRDSMLDFCLTLGAQALFVLWIPCLLAISIARAHHKLAMRALASCGLGFAAAEPLSTAHPLRASMDLRDRRILAEDRTFFVPRLCFGALLVLGTTYVFAPFGLKASYMMSLIDDHALPGHTSFALWANSFSAAPVIVVGFVGFLIYALITATQRFAQDDLDDQALFSLLVRGLVVILLSFALSASPVNDQIGGLFVFIAGVFPVRALEAIAKRANISIDPDFPSDGPGSFDGIPSLDPAKVFALRAAGIQSSYDLAAMPIEEIVGRVRIDPRLLGRAVDRAILIDAVGLQLTAQLDAFAITSATELVAAMQQGMPASVTEKLGDAPHRAADRLACDARVAKIQRWLAGDQG